MPTAVTIDLMILYALATKVWLRPKVVLALLEEFGSPEAIWASEPDVVAAAAGLDDEPRERLIAVREETDGLLEELERLVGNGVTPIGISDASYPERLRALDDPPPIIFVRGNLPDENQTAVAVVGSHHADAAGIREAVAWGKGFAQRNVAVISGLARGIDGGAHTGALAGNGVTVAVTGCGFANTYPPEHRTLADEIAAQGALISEYPPATPLTKGRLVYRNRLIVALADAVVVVCITEDSRGSMEAIHRARDLARPIFLVATESGQTSQRAVAEGAIPVGHEPDFDLVLNFL